MTLHTTAAGLSAVAMVMALTGTASAATTPLPKRIVLTAQNDTRVQYLVPDTDVDDDPPPIDAPDAAPPAPGDPAAADHVSGRRTRMPTRISVLYVSASGETTKAALHGLSTAHLPTCGMANEERIEGIVSPIRADCMNMDDVAVAYTIEHVEHGMGYSITVHIPSLFHYSHSIAAGQEETSFTSFIDGSHCSYTGPSAHAASATDTCDPHIAVHFGKTGRDN